MTKKYSNDFSESHTYTGWKNIAADFRLRLKLCSLQHAVPLHFSLSGK